MKTLKKILLVDDDREDQYLFMEALDTLNLSVQCKTVSNGKEALKHLDLISQYEFIFLDLNMPMMNGLECLQALKHHAKYKDIPVIIFTTSTNAHEMENCLSMGAKSLFHKPHTFPALCSELHNILTTAN